MLRLLPIKSVKQAKAVMEMQNLTSLMITMHNTRKRSLRLEPIHRLLVVP